MLLIVGSEWRPWQLSELSSQRIDVEAKNTWGGQSGCVHVASCRSDRNHGWGACELEWLQTCATAQVRPHGVVSVLARSGLSGARDQERAAGGKAGHRSSARAQGWRVRVQMRYGHEQRQAHRTTATLSPEAPLNARVVSALVGRKTSGAPFTPTAFHF